MKKVEYFLIQLEGYFYLNYPFIFELFNESNDTNNLDTINSDFKELYHWYNGCNTLEYAVNELVEFCTFGYFLSIEDGKKYQKEFIDNKYFDNINLFPFIASFSGDFLMIDLSKRNGEIFLYSPELLIIEPIEVYESIESFIETIYNCYEKKAYTFNKSRNLEIDYELEQSIVRKFNSKISFWYE